MKATLNAVIAVTLGIVMLIGPATKAGAQDAQRWKGGISWASQDTGAPDCPWLYVTVPDCLATGVFNLGGNRACVIAHATDQARQGQDGAAFALVLITQCHNPGAQQDLINAGPYAVANFLRNGF